MRRPAARTWLTLTVATAAAVLLINYPVTVLPAHQISVAALPVLAVALLCGPLAGGVAAVVVAAAATAMQGMTGQLALLLCAAPLVGYAHARQLPPAYAVLGAPLAVALLHNLVAIPGVDRLHLFTIDVLQGSLSVVLAFGVSLLVSARQPRRSGGWAGRPLTHRLFVTLAAVATVLTVGLGLLSATNLQERQVRSSLANLKLLSLEVAESTQVLLRAQARSLAAFGRSLTQSNLDEANPELAARVAAYASTQAELLSVMFARADGQVIAAAATRPTLDGARVLKENVSDREYFRGAVTQGAPYVTDTFQGRGFGNDIIVAISAPVHQANRLKGVIEGSLNLVQLSQVLDSASSRRGLDIVLVDRTHRVVAARGASPIDTGRLFIAPEGAVSEADVRSGRASAAAAVSRLTASARLEPLGWTVHVTQPASVLIPALDAQFRTVVRDMAISLICVFALSILFADVLARPLGQFARALAGGPDAGGRGLLRAVRTAPGEIRRFALTLVRAQRRQFRGLRRQQQLVAEKDRLNRELQELNRELDRIVEARTRVLAEREWQLRSSEARWRTMAEIAPDAVVVIDEDNLIHFVNSAMLAMSGHAAEELVGKRLETLIPERLRRGHWHGLQRYLGTGTRRMNWRSSEATLLGKDGTERPVEIAFGEYTLDGRRYFAGYLRDIAERKRDEADMIRARDLAESASRSKDAFLATMSHEIRTPLHGLIGTLDLVAREPLEPRTATRLEIARNSARSLLQIADDVLDLSGIEAGRVRIETVAFDLRDLVAVVCTSFEAGAVEKGLRLEHEVDSDVPGWVEGDPLRLRQILANLLSNGVKFTPRGRISLHVCRAGAESNDVVFDVTDTGVGVPADKRDYIFDRFAQADDERTRRFGGAGLGLAISRLLARAMGGELELAATGPPGSTFQLRLPLPAASPGEETDSGTTLTQPRLVFDPEWRPRVLVVDDNPANRYVVEAYLQEFGVDAVIADTADAGLAELRRGRFDLVLMDVQMPGKDGYQATREIRAGVGSAVPVVAMTANANIGERERCEVAGINDLLVKPFDAHALAEVLQRNLRADAAGAARAAAAAATDLPLLDTGGSSSVLRRFAGRPGTLARLYTALQESIAMHLETVRRSRVEPAVDLSQSLHGLKGATGMYGAARLQRCVQAVEDSLAAGVPPADLEKQLDGLEHVGRETIEAVRRLLETLAAEQSAGA